MLFRKLTIGLFFVINFFLENMSILSFYDSFLGYILIRRTVLN
jgi:hypothetical protein